MEEGNFPLCWKCCYVIEQAATSRKGFSYFEIVGCKLEGACPVTGEDAQKAVSRYFSKEKKHEEI